MKNYPILLLITGMLILSACSPAPSASPTLAVTPVPPTASPLPPTATPEPKAMTVCLGQEPTSLYLYSGSRTPGTWTVLEGIYDGPIDYVNYTYSPTILEKIPNIADGDAVISAVTIKTGMDMINADGNWQTLQKGVRYFPSGCSTTDCALEYDGKSDIQLDQLTVTFKIKNGITWSDGTPLTAADSVYSFFLASHPATPGNKNLIKKTASYLASDPQTVVWTGIPGFLDQQYMTRFWIPQPEHIFSGKDPASLLEDPLAKEKPLGWGPFLVSEWVAGDHIKLTQNPAYYRASEGLPKLDVVNIRFLNGTAQTSMDALLSGECDVVDESSLLDEQISVIKDLQLAGKLKASINPSTVWEGLYFGIKPASYDDGYFINRGDRPDLFGDPRTRQALAMCINRQKILDDFWSGFGSLPTGYLGSTDPLTAAGLAAYPYDPQKANALLEEIGWKDMDNNPLTPRVAVNMPTLFLGSPLQLTLHTTNAQLRAKVSEQIVSDLAQCGIPVAVTTLTPEDLFATGPEGVLFGRKFDLALFSWSPSTMHPCEFYTSDQINRADRGWTGVNVTGYSSEGFDAACANAASSLPGQPDYEEKQQAPQLLFSQEIPALSMYPLLRISVANPLVCGYGLDATSRSGFWNIESIDIGSGC